MTDNDAIIVGQCDYSLVGISEYRRFNGGECKMERKNRKNMQTASYYNSPIGKILLASDEQGLIGLWLDTDRYYGDNLDKEYSEGGNKYLASAKKWLDIYFQGKEPDFTPQLHLIGTDFQKRVWQALLKIPYGMTTTYKDIAVQAAKDALLVLITI